MKKLPSISVLIFIFLHSFVLGAERTPQLLSNEYPDSEGASFAAFHRNGLMATIHWSMGFVTIWRIDQVSKKAAIISMLGTGFRDDIVQVAFNKIGDKIITAHQNLKQVKIWDVETGKLLLRRDHESVESISLSSDDKEIVIAGGNKAVAIWNVETKTITHLPLTARRAVFHPQDNTKIVLQTEDNTGKIVQAHDGTVIASFGNRGDVINPMFNADGSKIVSGVSYCGIGKVWDAKTGLLLFELSGHSESINSSSFSPNGQQIATGSKDKTTKIWSAADGRLLFTIPSPESAFFVFHAVFTPESEKLLVMTYRAKPEFWSIPQSLPYTDLSFFKKS